MSFPKKVFWDDPMEKALNRHPENVFRMEDRRVVLVEPLPRDCPICGHAMDVQHEQTNLTTFTCRRLLGDQEDISRSHFIKITVEGHGEVAGERLDRAISKMKATPP